MRQKGSCFQPVVLYAALVLLILPMVVSAERHNSPGTVYTINDASEPEANEVSVYKNLNSRSTEHELRPRNASFLRRAWETFDDNDLVPEPPPTGFVLESALGLEFPSSVVGIIASPIIRDETIYYVDVLGTVFARDARSGLATDPTKHWTSTLVDPDFDNNDLPVLPELIYTTPVVSKTHVWVVGSVYGQLHRLDRDSGSEFDFKPSTPEVDPFQLAEGLPFSSVLGDAVIVEDDDLRNLLVVSINVILNDALVQGDEVGLQIAYDITNPDEPVEKWRTPTIDVNPATGLRYGSGVSAGSSLAVDYRRGYLFGGTGQNTTEPYTGYPDPELVPEGYVDRSDSLYAVDFNTGEFVWTNQFHAGDVFNLNEPVSTGPNRLDGPRDADVLSPPVLFSARIKGHRIDLVGNGSKGMVYVPYGNQNHPSGGIIAYEVNQRPRAKNDRVRVSASSEPVMIDALDNDSDPNGDRLRFSIVGGQHITQDDGHADKIELPYGQIEVFNPGDDPDDPETAYLKFTPSKRFRGLRHLIYQVEDIAPNRVVNGIELDEPDPTHRLRTAHARVRLIRRR